MNDTELKQLLQRAKVPAQEPAFWTGFTEQVMDNVRATTPALASRGGRAQPKVSWAWGWAAGVAAVCLLVGFGVGFWKGQASRLEAVQMAAMQKYFREIQAMFPHQVRGIVYDEKGPRILLAEKANLPSATPVYLEIKSAQGSRRFVTFSGEKIKINGEECEVLENASGHIMLVGKHFLWTQNQPANASYQIHARTLPTTL
jgi:hypothetical protein